MRNIKNKKTRKRCTNNKMKAISNMRYRSGKNER